MQLFRDFINHFWYFQTIISEFIVLSRYYHKLGCLVYKKIEIKRVENHQKLGGSFKSYLRLFIKIYNFDILNLMNLVV